MNHCPCNRPLPPAHRCRICGLSDDDLRVEVPVSKALVRRGRKYVEVSDKPKRETR